MAHGPKVVIVGAGVIGASIAYHLARAGARVDLFENAPRPAEGVTGAAFGWINSIHGTPQDQAAFALLLQGLEDFERLALELPELLLPARRGSFIWHEREEDTLALFERHTHAGSNVELVEPRKIGALEPSLRQRPSLAVLSPRDIAVSPVHLTRVMLAAAEALGCVVHYQQSVSALIQTQGRLSGVVLPNGTWEADCVILAAGPQTTMLAHSIGISLEVDRSPAVLLRYSCEAQFIERIINTPVLEIRQQGDGMLLVAKSLRAGMAEDNFQSVSQKVRDVIIDTFDVPSPIQFHSALVGHRPIAPNGLPLFGPAADVAGLHIVVGHPGVILAPLLGRLTSELITSG